MVLFHYYLDKVPLAAAGGFVGGFIGDKMGGKMGGFAGGLVGTATVTLIQKALQVLESWVKQ